MSFIRFSIITKQFRTREGREPDQRHTVSLQQKKDMIQVSLGSLDVADFVAVVCIFIFNFTMATELSVT